MLALWALGAEALMGAHGPKQKLMRFREQPHMTFRVRVSVRWFSVGPMGPGATGS